MQRKIEKTSFVFDILVSELVRCVNFSLLRRECLSSAINVLRNSLKILNRTRKTFSNSITFEVINKYSKGAVAQNATVDGHVYHIACERVL